MLIWFVAFVWKESLKVGFSLKREREREREREGQIEWIEIVVLSNFLCLC